MTSFSTIPLATDRSEWLKQRQAGIGGSDVAPILGISKWRTPLDVYNDKTSEVCDEKDNTSMEWGRRLEPVIRQAYADETGANVIVPSVMYRSEEHPFMIANVDGIREDGTILEIKTARSGADWGEPGTSDIPQYYLTQVQHYMTVLGAPRCDIAVLIGASDFRIYTVENDPELADLLIEEEAAFWDKVQRRQPPAPRTFEEVSRAFSKSVAGKVSADGVTESLLKELIRVQADMKDLKEREEELKSGITSFMADKDTLIDSFGNVLATWKSTKPRVTFDSAALKKDMPDIWNQYAKTGDASRRFLIKAKLEE